MAGHVHIVFGVELAIGVFYVDSLHALRGDHDANLALLSLLLLLV